MFQVGFSHSSDWFIGVGESYCFLCSVGDKNYIFFHTQLMIWIQGNEGQLKQFFPISDLFVEFEVFSFLWHRIDVNKLLFTK